MSKLKQIEKPKSMDAKPEPTNADEFNRLSDKDRKRARAIAQVLGCPSCQGHNVLKKMANNEVEKLDVLMDPEQSKPGPSNIDARRNLIEPVTRRVETAE